MQEIVEALPTRPAMALRGVLFRHDAATLREALRKMILVRRFEESAEQAYMRGLIHGTMHLSIGQEASAIGATLPLTDDDYITSTHRGHGHCIGKGAPRDSETLPGSRQNVREITRRSPGSCYHFELAASGR